MGLGRTAILSVHRTDKTILNTSAQNTAFIFSHTQEPPQCYIFFSSLQERYSHATGTTENTTSGLGTEAGGLKQKAGQTHTVLA